MAAEQANHFELFCNVHKKFSGPKKLFHKAAPGEKISYLDVTSLYP
jgi:hypothetical protein